MVSRGVMKFLRTTGARQDPFPASGDGGGPELCAAGGVVDGDSTGEDTLLPLGRPEGSVGLRHQFLMCWEHATVHENVYTTSEACPSEEGRIDTGATSPSPV
jgi:hypothetical protein